MKNKNGITMITLIITIIVIILIASITIFTGLDTVEKIRNKEAKDTVNAVHLALIANEKDIPSGLNDGKSLADYNDFTDRTFSDSDFEIMGLEYDSGDCSIILNKISSGDNTIIYNYTYTNSNGKKYDNIEYTEYIETFKFNKDTEFDTNRGVNRPILSEKDMIPISGDNELVNNVFTENWYNYEKNISKYALMEYKEHIYAWIPRFAYKIQDFYYGQSYKYTPDSALDIVFLRENTDYMANGEVLPAGYQVHPAFANGLTGFWVMVESAEEINSISNASDNAKILNESGDEIGHLMKNSEYAATAYLAKFLNNNIIKYEGKEFVAAKYGEKNDVPENFDFYSSDYRSTIYIANVTGHALQDTPWNLKKESVLPNTEPQYLIRDVNEGGLFYFETTGGAINAVYRSVITE